MGWKSYETVLEVSILVNADSIGTCNLENQDHILAWYTYS